MHASRFLSAAAVLIACAFCSGSRTTKVSIVNKTLTVDGKDYKRFSLTGEGPAWFTQDGVSGLRFHANDGFDVTYVNQLAEDTVIHQHGLTPPHALDGVPFISTKPLAPGESLHSKFPLQSPTHQRNNVGSYFIHSHYGFQHELGVGAPLIVDGPMPEGYPEGASIDQARDVIMFLEDFSPYASENHTTPGYPNEDGEHPGDLYDYFLNGWNAEVATFNYSECMDPGIELDVSFKGHLVNGKTLADPVVVDVKAGERIRLRVIVNSGMSNYRLLLAGFNATVIAVDGQPVEPFSLKGPPQDAFFIAVAQRADIMITVPAEASGVYLIEAQVARNQPYSHLPTHSGLVLRVGNATVPTYNTTTAKAGGMMSDLDNGIVQEQSLKAFTPLSAVPDKETHWLQVNMSGDDGFQSLNSHSYRLVPMVKEYVPNPHPLMVSLGQRVCMAITNINADAHAMHLHGHSFQVMNMNGVPINGAVRDTLLTPRGGCTYMEICFDAENPGEWPFHCHMTYHLYAGMLTTVKYE